MPADPPSFAPPISKGMTDRTLRGLYWMFLCTGGQAVVQLVVLVVLARLVSPGEFGVVAAALVVVGFSTVFSQLGIGPAVVQRPDLQPAHLRTGFTLSVLLGTFLGGLLWLLAPAVADFFHQENLTGILRVLALVFPLQGLAVVAESLVQRELRFRLLGFLELAAMAIGYGGVGIALAFAGWGAWALVAAHLCQNTLKTILLLAVQPHPKRPLLQGRAFRELLFFGGGFTIARFSNYLASQGDNLVIGRWLGPVALGIYGRAYQLMQAPASLLGQVLDRVLFPAMARVQDQREKLAAAYRRGVALIALATLPASAALLLLAPEMVQVLLGEKWDAVLAPLQILAAGMLFRSSYKLSDSLVRATGAVYRRAWRQGTYAVLVFTGAVIGQFWGLAGVAVGVVLALAINFLLMAHLSLALTGLSWRGFAGAHVPGLALAGVVGLQVAAIAGIARTWDLPPLLTLLTCSAIILPTLFLMYRLPQQFLGDDGRWMVRRLFALRAKGVGET